jgi:hypothetical protein
MSSPLTYTAIKEIPSIVNTLRNTFNTGKKWVPFFLKLGVSHFFSLGLTKDVTFRKQQLKQLLMFMNDKRDDLIDALYNDLHKHKMESNIGELSSIIDECQYMIKVTCVCEKKSIRLIFHLLSGCIEHGSTDETRHHEQTIQDERSRQNHYPEGSQGCCSCHW